MRSPTGGPTSRRSPPQIPQIRLLRDSESVSSVPCNLWASVHRITRRYGNHRLHRFLPIPQIQNLLGICEIRPNPWNLWDSALVPRERIHLWLAGRGCTWKRPPPIFHVTVTVFRALMGMKIVGPAPRKQAPAGVESAPRRRGDAWKIALVVVLFAVAIGVAIGSRGEEPPVPPAAPPLQAEESGAESDVSEFAVSPDFDERSLEPWTGRN